MVNRLLNEDITRQVSEFFQQLQEPVQVLFFGSKNNCDYCEDTRQLIEEVVGTSDKLGLSVYDIDQDAGLAQQYKVDKTPGIVIPDETATRSWITVSAIPGSPPVTSSAR